MHFSWVYKGVRNRRLEGEQTWSIAVYGVQSLIIHRDLIAHFPFGEKELNGVLHWIFPSFWTCFSLEIIPFIDLPFRWIVKTGSFNCIQCDIKNLEWTLMKTGSYFYDMDKIGVFLLWPVNLLIISWCFHFFIWWVQNLMSPVKSHEDTCTTLICLNFYNMGNIFAGILFLLVAGYLHSLPLVLGTNRGWLPSRLWFTEEASQTLFFMLETHWS